MPQRREDRVGTATWLVWAAAISCPLSKVMVFGVLGGVFGITVGSRWFVTAGLATLLGTAVLLVRRHVRMRSKTTSTRRG